jgi:hypothetical protein
MPAIKKAASKKAGAKKPGLYANIQAKHKRIEEGSREHMREPGEKGAPSSEAFTKSAKTSTTAKKDGREPAAKKTVAKKTAARRTSTG